MEYFYENFIIPPDQSFTMRSGLIELKSHTILKSHINFEIALLENCIGKRFIGDHIEDFEGAELILLGSYLPHCWQYHQFVDPRIQSKEMVIHFFPDFLGKQLLEKPEARELNDLLNNKAPKGVRFTGETVTHARIIMQQMLFETGLARAASMLRLLDILSTSSSYKILSSPYFNAIESSHEAQKINKVFDYIFTNFKKDITLNDVAATVPMSASAFCRFFKEKTGRTLIDFIKEVRIGYAAKLLLEGTHNVTEACYDSGYNSISNFNTHFKEAKKLSPRDFIKGYQVN
ncbi:MAG: helix-turn-helix domain-containing protein [Mucilaginibacter sp.]